MNRYVESGKLAGMVTCIARRDQIVHRETFGHQNLETNTPMSQDPIFRVYSMTKSIASVALMILYEESLFNLTYPVGQYFPIFMNAKVWGMSGTLDAPIRPMTVQDLLRHRVCP